MCFALIAGTVSKLNSQVTIDWSATAAWVALVVAIVSPIATAVINNRHQIKMKKLELFQQRKIETIESYLRAASNASYTIGVPDDFAECGALVLLYAPQDLHEKIIQLNKALEGTGFNSETSSLLYDVAAALKHEAEIC